MLDNKIEWFKNNFEEIYLDFKNGDVVKKEITFNDTVVEYANFLTNVVEMSNEEFIKATTKFLGKK